VSVRTLRFNPVPWLTIETLTPGATARLGSVMVPETVASWVCGHAQAAESAARVIDRMQARYDGREARCRDSSIQRTDSKGPAACGIDASPGKSSCGPVDKVPPPRDESGWRLRRGCAMPTVFRVPILSLRAINCSTSEDAVVNLRFFARCCVDPPTLTSDSCRPRLPHLRVILRRQTFV
jgi:hypothetical protein